MNLYFLFVYIEHNGDESPKGANVCMCVGIVLKNETSVE
jgi:hypothetical protein